MLNHMSPSEKLMYQTFALLVVQYGDITVEDAIREAAERCGVDWERVRNLVYRGRTEGREAAALGEESREGASS